MDIFQSNMMFPRVLSVPFVVAAIICHSVSAENSTNSKLQRYRQNSENLNDADTIVRADEKFDSIVTSEQSMVNVPGTTMKSGLRGDDYNGGPLFTTVMATATALGVGGVFWVGYRLLAYFFSIGGSWLNIAEYGMGGVIVGVGVLFYIVMNSLSKALK